MAPESSKNGSNIEQCDSVSKPSTMADYYQGRKKIMAEIIPILEMQVNEKTNQCSLLSKDIKELESIQDKIRAENEKLRNRISKRRMIPTVEEIIESQKVIIDKLKEDIKQLEDSQAIIILD